MGIREEQKEKRRQDILAAGLKVFTRKGYGAAKISDIAAEAGMSTGLMFHYFESKEKLYEELIKIGISGPMSMMEITYDEPIDFFEKSAEQVLRYIQEQPQVANMFVLMNQAFLSEGIPQNVKEMLCGFNIFNGTARIIEEGQRNKTIRDGNPYALAVAFWCAVQGIAEELAAFPECPCPEGEWLVDIIRRKNG